MDDLYALLRTLLPEALADSTIEKVKVWRRVTAANLACPDCKRYGGSYMVKTEVWAAAKGTGHLCVTCLEARLGRLLTTNDFTTAPCNDTIALGLRLAYSDVQTLPFDDLNRGEFVPAILTQLEERVAEVKPK